jgi:hypothetical protein
MISLRATRIAIETVRGKLCAVTFAHEVPGVQSTAGGIGDRRRDIVQ